MDNCEWLFEALYDLAEAADGAGFAQLAAHIEAGMDVFENEEKRIYEVLYTFKSSRRIPPEEPSLPANVILYREPNGPRTVWSEMVRMCSAPQQFGAGDTGSARPS